MKKILAMLPLLLMVTAADYPVWRDTLGSTADLRADGDSSGTVDQADYDLWKA